MNVFVVLLVRWMSGNKAVTPALGMAWSSMVTMRLMLSRTEQLLQVCVCFVEAGRISEVMQLRLEINLLSVRIKELKCKIGSK